MTREQANSRRTFIKGAAVTAAAAGTGTVAMPSIARAQTVTLKMQGAWGGQDIFNEMAQQYVSRVNAMSGGTLQIEYLLAGAVVRPFTIQDAVHEGVLDGGHHVPAYWYGKNRAASLFGTGPCYGWTANHVLAWIHQGGGKELYKELVEEVLGLDVVGFFCMPMPQQPLGWFKTPPAGPETFQGLKYRTVGLASDVFQAMGAAVAQLPGGEILPAMERGVIDAFEFNNPTSDRRFGAQDVAKNYVMGSYHQAAETFEIIFNKTKFDSLSAEHRAILEYAVEAANTANLSLAFDNYSKDLQGLIKENGVKLMRTPPSIIEAQLKAWDTVIARLEQDPFAKKVLDSQRAFGERVGFYQIVNDASYQQAYEHYFGRITL